MPSGTVKSACGQAQKMEAVGRLAGGIAHDFNNLMTVTLGFADLLQAGLEDTDPRGRWVQEIRPAGDRAADLTRQLLAFSRRQPLQPVVLNLNVVVVDVEQLLRRLIGEDIDVVVHLEPTLRPVQADPGQLSQVLMNLAMNARDAMPTGGTLTIRTANVYLGDAYQSEHGPRTQGLVEAGWAVLLEVKDTGEGMDAATQERIFEPFFTTKGLGKGTGLGLATVYGIAKQSGGDIWVESRPGAGTTFHIYLPASGGEIIHREVTLEGGVPSGHETVLVVEDESAVCALSQAMLESAGYTVYTARNAAEALEQLETSGPIDLLLTDVVLPGRNGRELAEEVGKRWASVHVLYMSGYPEDVGVRRGLFTGGAPFLGKPFTRASLTRKIRELLDDNDHRV
jgi:two-component system, cell cycle sensor histidine kinase and response regulator CckA